MELVWGEDPPRTAEKTLQSYVTRLRKGLGPEAIVRIIAPRTLASGSAFVIVLSPDADQTWLYLADGTNHKVWIMRRSDLEVVGEFGRGGRQVGQFLRPHGMSVDAKRGAMIVTTENPDGLALVDLGERRVLREFGSGGDAPHMVQLTADGAWAFASNTGSDKVSAVRLADGEIRDVAACKRPQGGVLTRDGATYYVTCSNSGKILAIDTQAMKVNGEIQTGVGVNRAALTPDGRTLAYSIGGDGAELGFADVATLKEVGRVSLGGSPLSCSLSKDGRYAFAGVQDNDEIYVVSVAARKVVQVIKTPAGAGPDPVMEIGEYRPPR